MQLYYDSAGPKVDPSVLARLKRLDPYLEVTFCRYAIDVRTSRPLEIHDWLDENEPQIEQRGGSAYVIQPEFHLWLRQSGDRCSLIRSYPAEGGFGHREVYGLEADAARFMRAQEILDTIRSRQQARAEKANQDFLERQKDISKANFSRIKRLVEGDDRGYRDARAVSYAGQGNRGTRGAIRKSDREDGWERP